MTPSTVPQEDRQALVKTLIDAVRERAKETGQKSDNTYLMKHGWDYVKGGSVGTFEDYLTAHPPEPPVQPVVVAASAPSLHTEPLAFQTIALGSSLRTQELPEKYKAYGSELEKFATGLDAEKTLLAMAGKQSHEILLKSNLLTTLFERKYGATMVGSHRNVVANQYVILAYMATTELLVYDENASCFWKYGKDGVWVFASDAEVYDDYLTWLPKLEEFGMRAKGKPQVLDVLRSVTRFKFERPDKSLVVVKGSVIDVRDSNNKTKVHGCSPLYFAKNYIDYQFDPNQPNPTGFLKYLNNVLDTTITGPGSEIDLLQRWCGTVLMGINPHHKIMILTGPGGSGKSTLSNIIQAIVGEKNVATLISSQLESRFELSGFFGKTLLVANDVNRNFLENKAAHMLKSLSGDKTFTAEVKHAQQRVVLEGPFNILLTSNSNLRVNLAGDEQAWSRRLLILEVKQKVKQPPKPAYVENLLKNEGPAILYWMMQGASRVMEDIRTHREFVIPDSIKTRIAAMLRRSDELIPFVKDCVESSPGCQVATEDLYFNYTNWAFKEDLEPMGESKFHHNIGRAIYTSFKSQLKNIGKKDSRLKGYTEVKLKEVKPIASAPPEVIGSGIESART